MQWYPAKIRTRDLLITDPMLYQVSHHKKEIRKNVIYNKFKYMAKEGIKAANQNVFVQENREGRLTTTDRQRRMVHQLLYVVP